MGKHFVKDPYLPSASGQNKTLKPRQNNVVINSGWETKDRPFLVEIQHIQKSGGKLQGPS
jgi:hypothetical protein